MPMRIIGGVYRSRLLAMPKGDRARPTMDRVREAIFNVIAPRVEGASVLDLYAGSGAYGLEALSRGAARAVFVESARQSLVAIRENIASLGIDRSKAEIISLDVTKSFGILERRRERFEIVFLDPPYGRGLARNTLIKIMRYDIVAPIHLIIAEHHRKDDLGGIDALLRIDERRYGDTVLSMFRHSETREGHDV